MVQEKNVQISTKSGTWDQNLPESLDGLMEQPAFNEATLSPLIRGGAQIKLHRETFSRSRALKDAPDYLMPIFKDLFDQIDRLDLLLNYYDLEHGKRKNPPREDLLEKFTPEEQNSIREESTHLNGYMYLKKRHDLVELRRQQFTYKDYYSAPIQRTVPMYLDAVDYGLSIGTEIPVFPLGLRGSDKVSQDIFREKFELEDYSPEQLENISRYYWDKDREKKKEYKHFIDFENEEHIYNLFLMFYDIEDAGGRENIEGNMKYLLDTLKFYVNYAKLSDVQLEIITLKEKRIRNQDIADYINQKYGKSYSANYISTIFRQKTVKQIVTAVQQHKLVVSNLWFPENFKKCNTCGQLLLVSADNFVRKARSHDGFSNRCKICDKLERQKNRR